MIWWHKRILKHTVTTGHGFGFYWRGVHCSCGKRWHVL